MTDKLENYDTRTKRNCVLCISPIRASYAANIILDLITLILANSKNCGAPHYTVICNLLSLPLITLGTLFSNILYLCFLLNATDQVAGSRFVVCKSIRCPYHRAVTQSQVGNLCFKCVLPKGCSSKTSVYSIALYQAIALDSKINGGNTPISHYKSS
jgi:hypothetical protein